MVKRRGTDRFVAGTVRATSTEAAACVLDLWESTAAGTRPAGVDEAGRGSLAGPVVAAAVIIVRPSPRYHRPLGWSIAAATIVQAAAVVVLAALKSAGWQ